MQNLDLALVILMAGVAVVFFMLIILIFIIKLYGSIIYSRQKKRPKSEMLKEDKIEKIDKKVYKKETDELIYNNKEDENEIVAVISAAIAFLRKSESKQYNITSIKQSGQEIYTGQSFWGIAGRFEMTKPF